MYKIENKVYEIDVCTPFVYNQNYEVILMTGKYILLKSNALVNAEIDNSNIEYKFTNLIFNETQLQIGFN